MTIKGKMYVIIYIFFRKEMERLAVLSGWEPEKARYSSRNSFISYFAFLFNSVEYR